MFLFPKVRDDGGVVVGAQGGQRLLDVVVPGQDLEAQPMRQVLSVALASPTSHPFAREKVEGDQEELEEVLC